MTVGGVDPAMAKTGDVVNHVFYGRKAKQLAAIMRRSRLQQERLSLTVLSFAQNGMASRQQR
jgi:hypothetical protein